MKWIEKQINSILFQKNVMVRIFISVDLSSDETYDWCLDLAQKTSNIELLPYGENFGGAAKNFFHLIREVNFSGFDYVALADQDDIWNEEKINHAIQVIKIENLEGFSSDVIAVWDDGRKRIVKKSYPQKQFDYYFESAGPGCTYLMKSQSLKKFKKFLISNWENVNLVELHDWLIYAYFRSQKMKWKIDNKPLMYYRQHNQNQFGLNYGLKAFLSRFNKIKTKWYRNEVKKIIDLLNKDSDKNLSLDRIFLIKYIWNLRRRYRDSIVLLFMIIFKIF